jgi:hypothetical protein
VKPHAPFRPQDLEELHARLLSQADRVVPMRDIHKGDVGRRVIGLRHDVDDNAGSFDTALAMARWEFDHGYSSTYYVLHDSHYWDADHLVRALEFEELGHEVGLHNNAIAEGIRQRRSPDWILLEALGDLRSVGLRVDGTVAHGDPLCRDVRGQVRFVNDEMFVECRRTDMGEPDRVVAHHNTAIMLHPQPLSDYHLAYDANWLPRGNYVSESGGRWSQDFGTVADGFGDVQLHVLVHPDWWEHAFAKVAA